MKCSTKISFSLATLALFFLSVGTVFAESITSYNTTIHIEPDASLQVREEIQYDFESIERHGIYRTIPIAYKNEKNTRYIKIENLSVQVDDTATTFSTSRSSDTIEIKIGDPNALVTGRKKYILNYTVRGALNDFPDHSELYWNAIGTDWKIPIMNATVLIQIPQSVTSTLLQTDCYTGTYGEKQPCATVRTNDLRGHAASATYVHNNLEPNQALTVVLGFPTGIVATTTPINAIEGMTSLAPGSNYWYLLIPLTCIIMFRYWWKYGRDPKGTNVIIAEYESPDNLSPAEVGLIYDNSLDNKDVSAEIIQLAIAGHLTITRLEAHGFFSKADYQLQKNTSGTKPLTDAQRALLTSLFKSGVTAGIVKLSELKNNFSTDFSRIRKIITNDLIAQGYLDKNRYYRAILTGIAGIALALSGVVVAVGINSSNLIISVIASSLLVLLFAAFMPARNKKSVLTREKILGLKRYITVAEKDRINFHNAPEKNPGLFEKLLPYAMVMGVETAWAKQFDGIYITPPNWYHDSTFGNGFNALLFAHNLHSFHTASTSTLVSTASSGTSGLGGGGFSGGGFGGGGGGSW